MDEMYNTRRLKNCIRQTPRVLIIQFHNRDRTTYAAYSLSFHVSPYLLVSRCIVPYVARSFVSFRAPTASQSRPSSRTIDPSYQEADGTLR